MEQIKIFLQVVQKGSFSRAAEALRLPKSTVSRAVSGLENASGTRLLTRTTRSLTLTAAGRAFYETCVGPMQILEDALKSLQGKDSIVSGVVRVTAPEDLGTHVLSRALGQLAQEHPGLAFEFNYTDEIVDLVGDGYDLAIRVGKLPSSALKARRLGDVTLILVASPDYAGKTVKHPRELENRDCLLYAARSAARSWSLRSTGESFEARLRPRLAGNQMSSLVAAAASGTGIALVPSFLCTEKIRTGELVRVLPDWRGPSLPVHLLTPSTSARLKVVGDRVSEVVRPLLEAPGRPSRGR